MAYIATHFQEPNPSSLQRTVVLKIYSNHSVWE